MDMKDSILIKLFKKRHRIKSLWIRTKEQQKCYFTHSNGYSNTRTTPSREAEIGRNGNQRDYSQNRTNPSRQTAPQKPQRKEIIPKTERFLQEKVGHKEMKVKEIILKPELI
jgi:hypothetical protein